MKAEGYAKPVLIAGIIAGVLSATPLLNLLNIICCLWILAGGIIAVYLVSTDTGRKINYGEGAFIGLLSGLVAAVVSSILYTIWISLGINIMKYLPERFTKFEQLGDIMTSIRFGLSTMILWLLYSIIIFGAFGALGGIIGTSKYGKKKEREAKA